MKSQGKIWIYIFTICKYAFTSNLLSINIPIQITITVIIPSRTSYYPFICCCTIIAKC